MIHSQQPAAPAEVAAHYDALDAFYRQIFGEHVHHGFWRTGRETREEAVRGLCDVVADELAMPPGASVCDIGCGYGATARRFAAHRGWQVTAVTVSPAQHAFAEQRDPGATNPRYVCGDWLQNELPADSFDGAYAIESSEHMPSLPGFFEQARRILRPGGRLVVTAWLAAGDAARWQQRFLLEPICHESRMPLMGTADDYRRAAHDAHFDLTRFEDLRRQVAPTWPRLAATFLAQLIRRPRNLRFLFRQHAGNRVFGQTVVRLCLAYRIGALRYGLFAFRAR